MRLLEYYLRATSNFAGFFAYLYIVFVILLLVHEDGEAFAMETLEAIAHLYTVYGV